MINITYRSKDKETQKSENKQLIGIVNALEGYSIPKGYTKLSHCPEVYTAIDKIADPISNMTLYLMENNENGDVRIENGLSRLVDIEPSKNMTAKQWMKALVRCLLLEGDGNAVVKPVYQDGFIEELLIVPAGQFSINLGKDFEDGYTIHIKDKKYNPSDLIHFVLNPSASSPYKGESYRFQLKDLAEGLKNSREIEAKFMEGRYMPSLIVQIESDVDDVTTKEGRAKLEDKFIKTEAGAPMFIPADMMDVKTITPLSLKDIAISDSVSNYKKTIAGLLGVPAFLLGEGEFNRDEYNTFIKDKVLSVAKVIEQTLTKQLLVNPKWYFKFNIKSLYAFDIQTYSEIGATLYDRGIMTGNEVRDLLDLSPKEGLDQLRVLENYINIEDVGLQNKLNKEGVNGTQTDVQSDEDTEG